MAAKKVEKEIIIPSIQKKTLRCKLVGDSMLCIHRFSEKAKRQIKDKQNRKAKQGRAVREPEVEYAQSLYWLDDKGQLRERNGDPNSHPDGFGFPAEGLKKCAVSAAVDVENVAKTQVRRAFFVLPFSGFVKIKGTPTMREDIVRVGGKGAGTGAADLRYRGAFWPWEMELEMILDTTVISPEQVINLLNRGGFAVGIGEHRPEKDGTWGMFHVE